MASAGRGSISAPLEQYSAVIEERFGMDESRSLVTSAATGGRGLAGSQGLGVSMRIEQIGRFFVKLGMKTEDRKTRIRHYWRKKIRHC